MSAIRWEGGGDRRRIARTSDISGDQSVMDHNYRWHLMLVESSSLCEVNWKVKTRLVATKSAGQKSFTSDTHTRARARAHTHSIHTNSWYTAHKLSPTAALRSWSPREVHAEYTFPGTCRCALPLCITARHWSGHLNCCLPWAFRIKRRNRSTSSHSPGFLLLLLVVVVFVFLCLFACLLLLFRYVCCCCCFVFVLFASLFVFVSFSHHF